MRKTRILSFGLAAFLISGCQSTLQRRNIIPHEPYSLSLSSSVTSSKPSHIYALLCNMNDLQEMRFTLSINEVYSTLVKAGVPHDNIYYIGSSTNVNCRAYSPSKEGFATACKELSKLVTTDDVLFYYNTNHGDRKQIAKGFWQSVISLSKTNSLNESELEAMISSIRPKYGVLCFPQCYGGGFAERLGKGYFIGISESKRSEPSYSLFIDGLAHYLIPVIFGAVSDNIRARVDTNKDRIISVSEAFNYAAKNDFFTHPILFFTPWKNTYQLFYQQVNPDDVSLDEKAMKKR